MTTTKTILRWARPAQILMILALCATLVTVCQMIASKATWEYIRINFQEKLRPEPVVSEADQALAEIDDSSKEFLLDGTVLLVKETMEPGIWGQVKTIRVADANNRTLYDGPPDQNPYTFITWSDRGDRRYEVVHGTNMEDRYGGNVDFSQMLCVRILGPDLRPSRTWVYDLALGAFVGYDLDGRITGYIGTQGLCLQRQEIQPFEKAQEYLYIKKTDAVNEMALWVGIHSAYLIDFEAAKVKEVFHLGEDTICTIHLGHWDDPKTGLYLPSLAMFTESGRGSVYLPVPERLLQIHLPSESFDPKVVATTQSGVYVKTSWIKGFPQTHDHNADYQWVLQNRDRPKQHIVRLMVVQGDGGLRQVSSFEWTEPASNVTSDVAWKKWFRWINDIFAAVSPLPSKYVSIWGNDIDPTRSTSTYLWHLIEPFLRLEVYLPINLAVTLLLASLALVRAWPRRTGWGRLVFWMVLVLAFNLAGLLTYLALNHTPVIRCSACGRRRGLLRPDCPACHAPLPVPQPRPTDLVLGLTKI